MVPVPGARRVASTQPVSGYGLALTHNYRQFRRYSSQVLRLPLRLPAALAKARHNARGVACLRHHRGANGRRCRGRVAGGVRRPSCRRRARCRSPGSHFWLGPGRCEVNRCTASVGPCGSVTCDFPGKTVINSAGLKAGLDDPPRLPLPQVTPVAHPRTRPGGAAAPGPWRAASGRD